MRFSLRTVIPVSLILYGLLIGFISYYQGAEERRGQTEDAGLEETRERISRLQGTLERDFRGNDLDSAQDEISFLSSVSNTLSAFVLDENDAVLLSSHLASRGRLFSEVAGVLSTEPPALLGALILAARTGAGSVSLAQDQQSVIGVFPVLLGAEANELRPSRVGVLFLQYDLSEETAAGQAAEIRQASWFFLMLVGLSLGLWLFFHLQINQRTEKIINATERLAAGDYQARIGLTGLHELNQIGLAFDRMAGRIEQSIIERRHAQEELQQILDAVKAQVWFLDTSAKIVWNNSAALLANPAAPLQGRTLSSLPSWEDPKLAHARCLEVIQKKKPMLGEIERYQLAGQSLWASVDRVPILSSEGAVTGLLVFVYDVSNMKRAEAALRESEEKLRQAQKMEAIGRLAGGVAHDFNNLLTIICGCSESLMFDLSPDDPSWEILQDIKDAGDKAAILTKQLLVFSRRQVLAPSNVEINPLLGRLEKMLSRLIGENISLQVKAAAPDNTVLVDPGQLEQAVMNLIINARDAMPGGGAITIETSNESTASGDVLKISIRDTGLGMSEETRSHIFEPFFTTKEAGKGTGLGLSMVYSLVQQSGGAISVESEPNHGTTFSLRLPLSAAAPQPTTSSDPKSVPAQKSAQILLVEDDNQVRRFTRSTLSQLGHIVLEASDAASALEIASNNKIDLLVTDIVMPGMNGRVLAQQLQLKLPGLKVLYVSGYNDDEILARGISLHELAFLQKPFSVSSLAAKLRELLG